MIFLILLAGYVFYDDEIITDITDESLRRGKLLSALCFAGAAFYLIAMIFFHMPVF